jgi:cell division septation protein DedD
VLIEADSIKLANFACPPQEEDEQQVTRLELRAYRAPEVIQGQPVTPAANVFSLGVMGFRLSAGSLPYSLTFDEAAPYRLEGMPADLEEIPLPLQNLLLQCLAPDPRDRFEDAGAFLAALEQRRESWRTPSYGKWIGLTPERKQQAAGVMASVSRVCGQFWEGSRGAVGKMTEGIQTWKEHAEPGQAKRLIIGLTGALLALTLLVWGGRTLFRKTEAPPSPALLAPAPSTSTPSAAGESKLPQTGVPPLNAATESAPRAPAIATPATPPGAQKEGKAQAQASKERYQLWVATYRTYDEALVLKKKIQAQNVPVTVYRGAVDKKLYFAVKAGPFTSKKQAEDMAGRLKSEIHLAQAPKLVKVETEPANSKSNGNSKSNTHSKTNADSKSNTNSKTSTPKAPR